MEQFYQVTAVVLMSIIMVMMLKNRDQGIGQLLSILVCTIVLIMAVRGILPVVSYIKTVQGVIALDSGLMKNLMKCVGISITAEIAELICQDSGNGAMGKALQLFSTVVISCMCIPMLTALLDLIQEVLSNI